MSKESCFRYCWCNYALHPQTFYIGISKIPLGWSNEKYILKAVPNNSPDFPRIYNKYVSGKQRLLHDHFVYPGESWEMFLNYREPGEDFILFRPVEFVPSYFEAQPRDYDNQALEHQLRLEVFSSIPTEYWVIPQLSRLNTILHEKEDFDEEVRSAVVDYQRSVMSNLQFNLGPFPNSTSLLEGVKELCPLGFDPYAIYYEAMGRIPQTVKTRNHLGLVLSEYLLQFTKLYFVFPSPNSGENLGAFLGRCMTLVRTHNDSMDRHKTDPGSPELFASENNISLEWVLEQTGGEPWSQDVFEHVWSEARCDIGSLTTPEMEELIQEADACQECAPRDVFGREVLQVLQRHIRLMQTNTNRSLSRFDFESFFLNNTREINIYNRRVKEDMENFESIQQILREKHEREMNEFQQRRTELCQEFVKRLAVSREFINYSSSTPLTLSGAGSRSV